MESMRWPRHGTVTGSWAPSWLAAAPQANARRRTRTGLLAHLFLELLQTPVGVRVAVGPRTLPRQRVDLVAHFVAGGLILVQYALERILETGGASRSRGRPRDHRCPNLGLHLLDLAFRQRNLLGH